MLQFSSNVIRLQETSKFLVERNRHLKVELERYYSYLFSPRVRKFLFNLEHSYKWRQLNEYVVRCIEYFSEEVKKLLNSSQTYYRDAEELHDYFYNKKHYSLSLRFIQNSSDNFENIINFLNGIKTSFENLRKVYDFDGLKGNFHEVKSLFEELLKLLVKNETLLGDLQGRIIVQSNIVHTYEMLHQYYLDESALKTGDLLMSFKTKSYLKLFHFEDLMANVFNPNVGRHIIAQPLVARPISFVSSSQITHVAMAVRTNTRLMMVDAQISAVKLYDFTIKPGEVYIVLRPRITDYQRAMVLRSIRELLTKKIKYSILGTIMSVPSIIIGNTINLFNKGYTLVPNLMSFRTTKMFCSQFVNEAFKQAGVMLTPKSQYSDMVYPADIVSSPVVDYIGVVFDETERSEQIIKKHLENVLL